MNVKFSSTRPTSRVNLLSLECELIFNWKWFRGRQNVKISSLGFAWFFTGLVVNVISSSCIWFLCFLVNFLLPRFWILCFYSGCYIVGIWRGFRMVGGMIIEVYWIYCRLIVIHWHRYYCLLYLCLGQKHELKLGTSVSIFIQLLQYRYKIISSRHI